MSSKSKSQRDSSQFPGNSASLELKDPDACDSARRVHPRGSALLEKSWKLRSEDPVAAEELTRKALELMEREDVEPRTAAFKELNDLKALAWIYIANFRRIRSDFSAAEDMLLTAEGHLVEGTHRPSKRAHLLLVRAALYGDLRRLPEALDLMDQAIAIYRWADDDIQLARALLTKSHFLHTANDIEESLACLQQAGELIEDQEDPKLALVVQQHRLLYYCVTDQAELGWELLPEVLRLAREVGDRLERVRVRWAKGLLEGKLGFIDAAEKTLREVRRTFMDDKIYNDVAQVTLDLAVVLLEAGRLAETRELAEEMLPLFESLDIRREAFAALLLFRRAALQEEATAGMARDIGAFLKSTGTAPALKYEEPS